MERKRIRVGMMGLGVVGSGVARILMEKVNRIQAHLDYPVELAKILVREPGKERAVRVPQELITKQSRDILDDPSIDIVIEVMGGETPAHGYIQEAIQSGKHVITANKEVMAKYGPELLTMANQRGVDILYEASVGGGIPLIGPFQQDLAANKITSIQAIINGTTNYILTRMADQGAEFSTALAEAQSLGYAEADPTNDVEGIDACYKLSILATLAFHLPVRPWDVYREGITRLTSRDFCYARELGYAIKLLAIAREEGGMVEARVHPTLVPQSLLMAQIGGVFNAVRVDGDLVGTVIFYGPGAGSRPTTSAIVADLIHLGKNITSGLTGRFRLREDGGKSISPMTQVRTRYYLRMDVADNPGVLAQIASILGENKISIASVIQKEANPEAQLAEIVIMTHQARELDMQDAMAKLRGLPVVREIAGFLRAEG
ncbi:MAG: homoserine dehydrogenase [Dehalococcoidia bacterium]|nr:homoserine dehydrogenase [Dehalococcoidia bacterium]